MRSEDGVTIVELLVASTLTLILSMLAMRALGAAMRTDAYGTERSETLSALRVSFERATKEIRSARRVYADSTARSIHIWVDSDRDGTSAGDPGERVVWQVRTGTRGAELVRWTHSAPTQVQLVADGLVPADAFEYTPAAATVRFTITGDVDPGRRAASQTLTTLLRLRNVQA